MIQGMYNSLSALNAYSDSVAAAAGNIANLSTPGYKSASLALADTAAGGVKVSSIIRNSGVSYAINTGNNLDLAIQSDGYFRVTSPNGNATYTRNGNFNLDTQGDLVDSNGNVLLTNVGTNASSVSVASDGTVTADGQVRGQINLYDSSGQQMNQNNVDIQAGALEASNVDIAKQIIDMNLAQKAFSFNIAALKTQDEMLGTIIDLRG